jgi:hypothetical protein
MSWGLILFVVLLLALVLAVPLWPYSSAWGPIPSAVLLVATLLVGLKVFGVV